MLLLASVVAFHATAALARNPNIVYILCDDLGYGDVHCLNPERGKIATPCIDRLASQGMTFTDAHSTSAVCTPTRYSVLTGRYNWRTRLQSGVLHGFGPPLIAPERLTLPALLKHQGGYRTACIGKWHLGMTFQGEVKNWDLTKPIKDGPTARGFDYFFGISASLDMPPFAYIENDHFTQLPNVTKTWVRSGPAAPDFEAVDVLPMLTRKAEEFIMASAATNQPFFLYLPLTSPHTPLLPTKEWQGKSGLGEYGDFVMATDWAIGEVLAALDKAGIAGNTLVIVTSDNGCAPYIGVEDLEKQGHYPSGDRRGYKADIWDGGHRVPFIARWPGKVKAGSISDQLVSLVDLMATCADMVGAKIPANAGEDSVSFLPALLGTASAPLREALVFHSLNGSFAIRQGRWKLELCPDSGGWSAPKPGSQEAQGLPPVQLYDMAKDVGERTNEYEKHPEVVAQLTQLLEKYVADGCSTPNATGVNDVPVTIRKKRSSSKNDSGKPLADAVEPATILAAMERVADWQLANPKLANPSLRRPTDWTHAAGYAGIMALAGISGDSKYHAAMMTMSVSNEWKLGPREYHADDHAVGQTYAELYLQHRDPKMLAPMRALFDDILANPRPGTLQFRTPGCQDRWSWCDALFMSPPAWVRLYAATGDERYLDFAVTNWWRTSDYLYDTNEHLYFRDSTFFDQREANGAKIFWSRGNGWVMGGLVRVLQYLPKNHPDRPRFERQFKEMSAKILTCQQPDGLWRASLLDPASYPLKETSGSGFYIYSLAWGINHGLLDRAQYEVAVRKGWLALVNCVAPDGKLTHVQPIGADPRRFDENATEVYGGGAFLLAGSQVHQLAKTQGAFQARTRDGP